MLTCWFTRFHPLVLFTLRIAFPLMKCGEASAFLCEGTLHISFIRWQFNKLIIWKIEVASIATFFIAFIFNYSNIALQSQRQQEHFNDTVRVMLITIMTPVLASFWGIFFNHEPLNSHLILGLIFLCTGLFLYADRSSPHRIK